MNIIDLFLIFILLLNVYIGYQKGFIAGILQLLMLSAGLLCAFFMYPFFASFLVKSFPNVGIWKIPLSFIIALITARIIFSFIANHILASTPDSYHTNAANRIMGVVPGAVNGIIWALIIAAILLTIPFSDRLFTLARDSVVAGKVADKTDILQEKLSPFLNELVSEPIGKVTLNKDTEQGVSLPFKVKDPKAREDLEAKMLILVNEERQKAGVKPLKADPEMLVVAREHSKDMFARGYFSHETPEGLSPFDRMKEAKVRFLAAGENLALGPSLAICHRGLMHSPGHRKNILNPAFGRVGIGILDGGIYGLMVTQNFRN